MHLDPILPVLVATLLAVVVAGILMRWMRQPFIIGCLLVGVVLGPSLLNVLEDAENVGRLGAIGVVFLLFFAGMAIDPKSLQKTWRAAFLGTSAQIAISLACVWVLGELLDWPVSRVVLLGFVISLSSTAVVLRLLESWGETETRSGRSTLAIVVSQDLAVVPMMLVISFLAGERAGTGTIVGQVVGGILVTGSMVWMVRQNELRFPLLERIRADEEMSVFVALVPALGLALVTGLMGLSTGLGAFFGGMMVALSADSKWIAERLKPFEVLFIGLFFVSIGMLIDLEFLVAHWGAIGSLVAVVMITNTFINAVVMRLVGCDWRKSIVAGSLLAPIGEFSFVLAAVGRQVGVISEYSYQMTMLTIALTMVISPLWSSTMRKLAKPGPEGH